MALKKELLIGLAFVVIFIASMLWILNGPSGNATKLVHDSIATTVRNRATARGELTLSIMTPETEYLFAVDPYTDLEGSGLEMHEVVKMGDSVFKKAGSDTISFIRQGEWQHSWHIHIPEK